MRARLMVATVVGFLALTLTGCTAAATLKNAAFATNEAGELTASAATLLHDRCTLPMQRIAQEPAGETRQGHAAALAEKCDPASVAFEALRSLHIEARALMVKAASPTGVTVGDLLDMIDRLTATAGELALKIERVTQ